MLITNVNLTVDFSRALELDALDNSHPIEVPVGHPEEVDEIFDAISYCKGNLFNLSLIHHTKREVTTPVLRDVTSTFT